MQLQNKMAIPLQWQSRTELSVAMGSSKSSTRGGDWSTDKACLKGGKMEETERRRKAESGPHSALSFLGGFLANRLSGKAEGEDSVL